VIDGRCECPERALLPLGHLLEQILVCLLHGSARLFFVIGQDVRRLVDPLIGLGDRRP
jgi:hypothetical protein